MQVSDHVETSFGHGVDEGVEAPAAGPTRKQATPRGHLHFGLIDGLGLLSSDSLPFVIDRFTFEGQAEVSTTTGAVTITGTPRRVRNAHSLTNSLGSFTTPG